MASLFDYFNKKGKANQKKYALYHSIYIKV